MTSLRQPDSLLPKQPFGGPEISQVVWKGMWLEPIPQMVIYNLQWQTSKDQNWKKIQVSQEKHLCYNPVVTCRLIGIFIIA